MGIFKSCQRILLSESPRVFNATLTFVQNIDGTIGFLLPKSFKAKIKQAMDEGVGKVFGAVTNNKLAGALKNKNDRFEDRNLNVYRRPGDRAIAAAAAAAGGHTYQQSVRSDQFADPEAGFFDTTSQNGSFMSAIEVSDSSMLLTTSFSHLPRTSSMGLPARSCAAADSASAVPFFPPV